MLTGFTIKFVIKCLNLALLPVDNNIHNFVGKSLFSYEMILFCFSLMGTSLEVMFADAI
jgi:hypothetical protein